MIRTSLAAAGVLLLAACNMAPEGDSAAPSALDIPEIASGELSEATMKEVTERLSSDEFEGRMPGSAGEEKTVAYLIEKFKAAGLEPGNNGGWTQKVPLVEITGKDYAPLTIAGKEGEPMALAFGSDWVGVTYREDAKTSLKDSELVFVGYGIDAP